MLSGVGMVIPEQVQDAVGGEQVDLIRDDVPGASGLHGGNLRADHHIAEQAGNARGIGVVLLDMCATRLGRPQLVHREGEDVRGPFLAHPADVQLGHGRLIDQQQRQLSERVHVHLVEHVPGQAGQRGLVDRYP
jgi:hypothetical protein